MLTLHIYDYAIRLWGLLDKWKIYDRDLKIKVGIMVGFVMVVIWKVVKSGCVCAGILILLSLLEN